MSEETKVVCVGLDCGTKHLVSARSDTDDLRITRNVFLEVDKDDIPQMADISYIESDEGDAYVIGTHAFELANMLGQKVFIDNSHWYQHQASPELQPGSNLILQKGLLHINLLHMFKLYF